MRCVVRRLVSSVPAHKLVGAARIWPLRPACPTSAGIFFFWRLQSYARPDTVRRSPLVRNSATMIIFYRSYYCTGVWACTIISDTMMYILTVWKALRGLRSGTVRHSLFRALFFNGTSKRPLPELRC